MGGADIVVSRTGSPAGRELKVDLLSQVVDNDKGSMIRPVVSHLLPQFETAMSGGLYAEVRV
jgi:hypothetical protein